MNGLIMDSPGKISRVSYFILVFFVISVLIGSGVRYSNIYLFHILILPALIISLSVAYYENRLLSTLKSTSILWLVLGWYMVSYNWTLDKSFGKTYLTIMFLTFSTVFISQNFIISSKISNAIKYFYYVWILQMVLGFLEIYTIFRYPISKISKYNHLFGIDFYKEEYINSEWPRATGLSWGANDFSVFIILGMPFFLFYPMKKVLRCVGVVTIFYLINYNESRMCMLAILSMVFIKCIYEFQNIKTFFNKNKILLIPFVLGLFFAADAYTPQIKKHVERVINNVSVELHLGENLTPVIETESIRSRTRWYIKTTEAWAENPIRGLGVGSAGSKKIHPKRISIHFFILEVLTDSGLICFLLLGVGYLILLKKLYVISRYSVQDDSKTMARILFTILLTFIIANLSLSSVVYFLPFYLILGFSIGLCDKESLTDLDRLGSQVNA
jgi:hypothetical protein